MRSSTAIPRWPSSTSWPTRTCPGSRNEKRWEDVEELLDAGIDVISTVNIQHLESLNDVVEGITGIRQQETIPDAVVRAAEQIELVDSTPEALRRRMAHGNIYGPDKVDAALGNYFRPGNLAALRELALLWVADRVDESLQEYRERHGIAAPWETRERVAVAVTGAPGNDNLIRRASRIASRSKGDLVGVHVRADDGLATPGGAVLIEHRQLLEELGGTYREVVGSDVAKALVQAARSEGATQLVLGASHRSRWDELTRGSIIGGIIREAGRALDVHVISTSGDGTTERPPLPPIRTRLTPLPRRRQLAGLLLAVIGLPLLTLLLTPFRSDIGFTSAAFCYLMLVVAGGDGRGPLAGRARRRRRVRPPQLVLRRTHPHVHDPQRARPRRRGRVPPRRRRRQHAGRRLGPASGRGVTAPGARPRHSPAWPGRCCARATPSPSCSPTWWPSSGSTTPRSFASNPSLEVLAEAGTTPAAGTTTLTPPAHRRGRAARRGRRPAGRRPRGARRLRRPARRRPRDPAAAGGGGRRRGADAGQRAADRPARGRQPRPAHPAGVDQGVVVEPALRRCVVHRRAGPRPAGDDRRGGRPAQQPGGEPARHEPDPGRRPRGEVAGHRTRRGDRRRAQRPARSGPRHPPRRGRDAPGGRG